MIDVHVIHLPGERRDWWVECEASLVGHPITIHHLSGIVGDVKQARLRGYQLGEHPYVSFVDPDDVVRPGAFQELLNTLEEHSSVDGVYSLSDRIDHSGRSIGLIHPSRECSHNYLDRHVAEIHQMAAVKRECMLDVMFKNYVDIPLVVYTEITCFAMFAKQYTWKAVDHVGYEWRIHAGGAHNQPHDVRMEALSKLREIQLGTPLVQ